MAALAESSDINDMEQSLLF